MTPQTPPTDRPLTAGDFSWIQPMAEALAGYEADYGEGLDDMHELGRIDESRATPSFRIRVGHVRALAEILSRPATSAASEGEVGREAIWKVVHEVWQLLDDAVTDSAGVTTPNQERWNAVSEAMDALEALVPDSAGPFWGGFPVNYFWGLK